MKRKSILIIAAVMALAISIPVFAMAENTTGTQVLDGTGNMFGRGNGMAAQAALQAGDPLMLQDCDEEDCDCEALGTGLGADGEALHQFANGIAGRGMTAAVSDTQVRGSQPAGGRGRRGIN